MNVQDFYKLKTIGYLAPDSAVIEMARDYREATQTGINVRGTYLKVLLAHSQKALADVVGDALRAEKETALAVVQSQHERLYALVLGAVTTPDVALDSGLPDAEKRRRSLERNRRSNFARTAKSSLLAFTNAGGDLKSLKPEDTTKEQLRDWMRTAAPPAPPRETTRLEGQLEKAVRAMAKEDREEALDFIEELHVRLLQIAARPLTDRVMRRGEVTLHPSH